MSDPVYILSLQKTYSLLEFKKKKNNSCENLKNPAMEQMFKRFKIYTMQHYLWRELSRGQLENVGGMQEAVLKYRLTFTQLLDTQKEFEGIRGRYCRKDRN